MKKTDYLFLFLISILFFSLMATLQKVPGYMDAEYYYGQAVGFSEGNGLKEQFIWNYLNDPSTLPVEGFSFWLPLTSIIASLGIWITHSPDYFSAKIPFVILAAVVPLLAAYFADQFQPGRRSGWLAGGVVLLSGFYFPFITITDTFTPYMVLGGLFFYFLHRMEPAQIKNKHTPGFILVGLAIGLMSLTRSDGIFWLLAGFIAILWINKSHDRRLKRILIDFTFLVLGFCVVMVPWYLHNWTIYHAFYPPGNSLMLWLKSYNDLFVYPSTKLSFSHWINSGLSAILVDRLNTLGVNLKTLIASGGGVILTPLMVIGYWKCRKMKVVRLGAMMIFIILAIMTIFFPYAGERGGFFHSLSSVQILLWALMPVGLETIICWGMKKRNWKNKRAWIMFSIAILTAMTGLSALIMVEKLNKGVENDIPWNQSQNIYFLIETSLTGLDKDKNKIVMINDPPGYTLATKRQSIMIPSSGTESILAVCERYGVDFMVLSGERYDVQILMEQDTQLSERFVLLFEEGDTKVYEFKSE